MAPSVEVQWVAYTDKPKPENSCFLPSWKPIDNDKLHTAQVSILEYAAKKGLQLEQSDIETGCGTLHCIRAKGRGEGNDLLVLHGFGGGSALWALNMEAMADSCGGHVYFVDLPGFGRSQRAKTASYKSTAEAEDYFLTRIEGLRKAAGISKATIIGHSFGGYISACYAMKHPEVVSKVVLVDPWGVPVRDEAAKKRAKKMPWYIKCASNVAKWSGPLFLMRASGPLGPGLLPRFRPDLVSKWDGIFVNGQVADYIYQCNAMSPATGEETFMYLQIPFGYAKDPLCTRPFNASQDVHLIYGAESWMNPSHGKQIIDTHQGASSFTVIPNAGHHVYMDNIDKFNAALREVLQ
eukprot:TRINITY_DN3253_c0_g3_i1.p1 TRINITY_DN3253_c0_g3~~TRINITY_DN3253_c0_g3_i1.p1  ORF type:complete len:351 (+),score=46.39 TRINITY_DN3253_c0_g3_i1:45-1097(+)